MINEQPCSILFSRDSATQALATVCISLYNYQDYIVETLESVKAQTLDPIDLVVVEDCSTDKSLDVAHSWMTKNAENFNQVKLIQHNQNGGLPIARNTAILNADTPYIFILDADNLLYPNCVERCLESLDDEPEAAFAYPIIEKFGEEQAVMGNVVWERSQLAKVNCIDAMSLIRRDVLLQVNGYSKMGVTGWEDYELWCKFMDAGFYGIPVREILARYRTHKSSMLNSISNQEENIKKLHHEMLDLHPWLELERY